MFEHAYRYQIIHKPDQDLIHVKLWEEGTLLLDTGDVIDSSKESLRGGRLSSKMYASKRTEIRTCRLPL